MDPKHLLLSSTAAPFLDEELHHLAAVGTPRLNCRSWIPLRLNRELVALATPVRYPKMLSQEWSNTMKTMHRQPAMLLLTRASTTSPPSKEPVRSNTTMSKSATLDGTRRRHVCLAL